VDYFADHCSGVTVTLATVSGQVVLSGLSASETQLLKRCLGGSNFDTADNVEVYDWDYGSDTYPHLIKLVLTTAASGDGGYYVALRWNDVTSQFQLYNRMYVPDLEVGDNFDVYTTKGVLARSSPYHTARFGFAENAVITSALNENPSNVLWGDLACEINDNNGDKRNRWTRNTPDSQTTCLNKTDLFTMLSVEQQHNPPHINLYTVEKIYQTQFTKNDPLRPAYNQFNGTYVIETDIATNWGAVSSEHFFVYKFFPSSESSYTYVSQCSNRGICNTDSGLCECFHGYTNDDCSSQNSLAV
jgi:hypothetical protein